VRGRMAYGVVTSIIATPARRNWRSGYSWALLVL
jgi:hypothetical protein